MYYYLICYQFNQNLINLFIFFNHFFIMKLTSFVNYINILMQFIFLYLY